VPLAARARRVAPSKKPAKPAADQARKQRERERLQKEREREQLQKQKEKERLQKERERERQQLQKQKEKERLQKEREREREQLRKQKEKERLQKEREREQLQKQKEKERLQKEREREREQLRKQKEKELEQRRLEREQARIAAQKAREEERERKRREAAEERARKLAEREAARELARRQKEEERARREAEREAYRKAKEAERERLRAEREAARRALEGKVARASKRLQRGDGLLGRGITTTRVYRPEAIPDQSGTTRRVPEGAVVRPLGVRPPPLPQPQPVAVPAAVAETGAGAAPAPSPPESTPLPESTPEGKAEQMVSAPEQPAELERAAALTTPRIEPARATPPPPPSSLGIEERYQRILERLSHADAAFQREYRENFDMSWIYHDSALEGVVYTFQELKTAIDPNIPIVPDSSLQPACEEIRRHRQAIELVRELAERKRVPITVDTIKRLYVTLHPEEGDIKTVKYRKDIPQHRLYFHEYAAPDKIAYRVRQIVDWLNGPEPKKMKNPLRVAARVHYDLVRVFPFTTDSGKVARLLMNVILLRAGYPPAIIHSTERQRYYEALKGQLPVIIQMVADAISNALLSIEKLLDEHEARMRAGALG